MSDRSGSPARRPGAMVVGARAPSALPPHADGFVLPTVAGRREPYEKPQVIRVRLEAKEMAVAACKVLGGPNGPALSCRRLTHGACRSQGS